jgi:hypothetical protein
MATMVGDVVVIGRTYSAGGRTIEIRESVVDGCVGYQPWDVSTAAPRPLGNRLTLEGAVERVYQALCPQDPAVPGSDAAWDLAKRKDRARIAAANARWASAMQSGEPESPEVQS